MAQSEQWDIRPCTQCISQCIVLCRYKERTCIIPPLRCQLVYIPTCIGEIITPPKGYRFGLGTTLHRGWDDSVAFYHFALVQSKLSCTCEDIAVCICSVVSGSRQILFRKCYQLQYCRTCDVGTEGFVLQHLREPFVERDLVTYGRNEERPIE